MADVMSYIPFQRVKDWKAGDRIIVDGNPGKIRDIAQFKNHQGPEKQSPLSVWSTTMSRALLDLLTLIFTNSNLNANNYPPVDRDASVPYHRHDFPTDREDCPTDV